MANSTRTSLMPVALVEAAAAKVASREALTPTVVAVAKVAVMATVKVAVVERAAATVAAMAAATATTESDQGISPTMRRMSVGLTPAAR
ncbi:MAG: hypothetical protein V2I53_16290 [Paracoccaceae bacterium]|nr:hypothetical protein [Paracoccaceae bacterium]